QVLFLGPLMQLAMDCPWSFMDGVRVACGETCHTALTIRLEPGGGPLTEELVYRACMLPMLVPCAGPFTAIFTCPLFFGVAHFHHVIELLRFRQGTLSGIFLSAVFQFSYTAVFGAYTAFIFLRTGHLMGPVLCHSFCNYMGFPAISAALEHPQRLTVLAFYLLGVVLFILLLFPFTDPSHYGLPTPVCTLAPYPSALCLS
uniref:CAAX prenyl protease 2 n=1 Tax=Neogobius melanostomus TaxID=47308 RepID=A0A8C6U275_9GOBI